MPTLTILMPCLNESETLSLCLTKAFSWIEKSGIDAEVLVSDNGSIDGSQDIAKKLGARVVDAPEKGYGSALYFGASQAHGEYIIMGDSDDSYDFSSLDLFVKKLDEGCSLVMGNRFLGGIEKGAMPWKNRYFGNPILSWIGRILFRCPAKDFHCGLRAFTKEAFLKMDLRTTGMEFASEMVIKANLMGMKIAEVPTTLSKDGRSRPPHLRPWRDGWRHLRFMLLFSPRWLFIIPGSVLFIVSLILYVGLLFGPINLGSITFDIHTLLYAQTGTVLGFLSCCFGLITRLFGARENLFPNHEMLVFINSKPILEFGCTLSVVFIATGLYLSADALFFWKEHAFGMLNYGFLIRKVSISTLLLMIGGIIMFTSLIMGFLSLPLKRSK